jgi:serine/threonine-protein kinase RsbW
MRKILISIPNDIKLINIVMVGAVSYAQTLGFGEKECRHIELTLEEVLSNVIKYDYMPGQNENIDIFIETTTLGIGILIKSKGVPLDIDAIKSFEKVNPEDILNNDAHGLGILLIKSLADEVVYTNKGKEGEEVWIEKYLPYSRINQNENSPLAAVKKVEETSMVDFYIRRIKPEEAPVISRLAYYAYNLSYIYEHIYYPERVRQLNHTNELMSYVAVNKANEEIVGHCAFMQDKFSDLSEMAVAFVNPVYRGSGCLKELSKFQISDIKKLGYAGACVNAVTVHIYSQKVAFGLGLKESALFISRLTAMRMNKINEGNSARDALLYMCMFFKFFSPDKIFVPYHHCDMIAKIFSNIGIEVKSFETASAENCNVTDKMSVIETIRDVYSCVHIFVKQFGYDIISIVNKTLKNSCINRMETIYLYLPLDCLETSFMCSDFETMGFFFGGLQPGKDCKTWLLLQYLNNQKYDYEKLNFCSTFGNELLEYIKKYDPNIEIN